MKNNTSTITVVVIFKGAQRTSERKNITVKIMVSISSMSVHCLQLCAGDNKIGCGASGINFLYVLVQRLLDMPSVFFAAKEISKADAYVKCLSLDCH